MPKLHTRVKRKLGLVTSKKHKFINITKKNGQKTFLTEEKAKAHADSLKLKKYSIEPAKKNKRFKVVAE